MGTNDKPLKHRFCSVCQGIYQTRLKSKNPRIRKCLKCKPRKQRRPRIMPGQCMSHQFIEHKYDEGIVFFCRNCKGYYGWFHDGRQPSTDDIDGIIEGVNTR